MVRMLTTLSRPRLRATDYRQPAGLPSGAGIIEVRNWPCKCVADSGTPVTDAQLVAEGLSSLDACARGAEDVVTSFGRQVRRPKQLADYDI